MTKSDDDGRLREQARQAVRSGALPGRPPDRTWGGPGTGADCAVCHLPVAADEVELEMQFGGDDVPQPNEIHMHHRCFRAWDAERSSLETVPDGG
jgi:predicted CxxxxCH...CXXCH cytochrome family protein